MLCKFIRHRMVKFTDGFNHLGSFRGVSTGFQITNEILHHRIRDLWIACNPGNRTGKREIVGFASGVKP
jgi:hypothetical protein